jgi:hypothetical protein
MDALFERSFILLLHAALTPFNFRIARNAITDSRWTEAAHAAEEVWPHVPPAR